MLRSSLIALLSLAFLAPGQAVAVGGHHDPVGHVAVRATFADPAFLRVGGRFLAFSTGGDGRGGHFPVATAHRFLGRWHREPVTLQARPRWVGHDADGRIGAWAPSVRRTGRGRYLMYYSANRAFSGLHCVGAAVASRPVGPYRAGRHPLVCVRRAQVIDPYPVRVNGHLLVLYKVARRHHVQIRASRLTRNGLRTVGRPRVLVQRRSNIESPALVRRHGSYFLFVSTGSYKNCTYRTEVLRSRTLRSGTWRRVTHLMTTRSTGRCGPGGADVHWIGSRLLTVFHAWVCPRQIPCRRGSLRDRHRFRAMLVARIGWRHGIPFVR